MTPVAEMTQGTVKQKSGQLNHQASASPASTVTPAVAANGSELWPNPEAGLEGLVIVGPNASSVIPVGTKPLKQSYSRPNRVERGGKE